MSSKDGKDEFDVDIEGVCFVIDDDNDDLNGPSRDVGQEFVQSDEKKILESPQSSPIRINEFKVNDAATGSSEVFQETDPGKDSSGNKVLNDDLRLQDFDIEDDEMDLVMSQIEENVFENKVARKQSTPQKSFPGTSSRSFCEPVPNKNKRLEYSPVNSEEWHGKSPVKRPTPIRISKGSEVSPVNSEKWHGKSPVKRYFDSETCSFFLSQANTEESPVKRRFPGPAGMLPTLSRNELCKYKNNTYQSPSKSSSLRSPPLAETSNHRAQGLESIIPCGIVSTNCKTDSKLSLNKAPWKTMLQHLNLNVEDDNCLLNNINIGWLKLKANRIKRIEDIKERIRIPFLALVVRENSDLLTASSSSTDCNSMVQITLMDATGNIPAYMSPNVVNTFRNLIFPGTAIILRNCHLQKLYNELILGVMKKNIMCISVDVGEIEKDAVNDDGFESSSPIIPEGFSLHSYENGCGVMLQYTYSTNDVLEELYEFHTILKRTKEDQENVRDKLVINQRKSRLQLFTSVDTTKPSSHSGGGSGQLGQPDCGFEDDDDDDELFIRALQNFELNVEDENF